MEDEGERHVSTQHKINATACVALVSAKCLVAFVISDCLCVRVSVLRVSRVNVAAFGISYFLRFPFCPPVVQAFFLDRVRSLPAFCVCVSVCVALPFFFL